MKRWRYFVLATTIAGMAASAQADLILHYDFEPGNTHDEGSSFVDVSPTQPNIAYTSGGDDGNSDPEWDVERGNVQRIGANKGFAVDNANGIAAAGTFTIAGWYKGTDTGYFFDQESPRFVIEVENINAGSAGVHFNPGSGGTWYNNDVDSVNDGSWHHVAWVFTNDAVDTVFSFYLDGVAQDVDNTQGGVQLTRTMTGKGIANLTQQATNFRQRFCSKNNDSETSQLQGLYDDIRVYNTALTASEVSALYSSTAGAGEGWYGEKMRTMAPLEWYRLRWTEEAIGSGDLLLSNKKPGSTDAPALTPAGGFGGFESANSWVYLNGTDGGHLLYGLATGWNSTNGTISYWVCMDGDGDGTQTGVFGRETGGGGGVGGNNSIMVWQRTNGSLGLTFDNHASRQLDAGAGTLTMSEWHHLVFTWEMNTSGVADGVMRVYVDGEEVASSSDRAWDGFAVNEVRFGKEISGATRQFKGSADEIAIWTRTLSAAEVRKLWQRGKGIPDGTMVLIH